MALTSSNFDDDCTLQDVDFVARGTAREPGQGARAACRPKVSEDWHPNQLADSWPRSTLPGPCSFRNPAGDGFDRAMQRHGGNRDPELRERLLALCRAWPVECLPHRPHHIDADLRAIPDLAN